MIEVRTLGTVGVRGADGSDLTSLLAHPKRLALLIYLAVASRRSSVRRDSLLGLFWPEYEERRARASLRQALHGLRQHLGHEVLLTRGDDEVALDPEAVWCDAIAFEDCLSSGELEQAVKLYRGPMLEGFLLRGSVNVDQWVERKNP